MENFIQREFKVTNVYGIHARPAAQLVKTASRFASEIFMHKGARKVSAKSIMGILTLEGQHEDVVILSAKGVDAADALEAIAILFDKEFHQE